MKILIISQYFWPESFRINDLALSLQSRGHQVHILTGLPNYPAGKMFEGYGISSCGESDYQGIKVFRVPLFARRQGRSWQLALNFLTFMVSASFLGPFLCKDKYDIIFVYEPSPFTVGIPGVIFRKLKNAPMLFWVQDLWPESLSATGAIQSPFLLYLVSKMVRFIYRRCDRVLIQSRSFLEPSIAAGAFSDRVIYYPNYAEDLYQPIELEDGAAERQELPDGFCIMFAGNLGAAQSLETIVQSAIQLRDHKDIHWVIIGDGRREKWLKDKIIEHELEETIHLLGRKPVEKMPRYFSLADVLLVTLRSDPIFALTIPSKIQSYLACGKPIVGALDGEGSKVIRESGAGYTAPAGDVKLMADAVMKLYNLPVSVRKEMGSKGRAYYDQKFEKIKLLDQIENLMKKMTEEEICAS